MLIEVIVSALLVALIVIATFTGFTVADRSSGDQRDHNEAAQLAAESQEQLRTLPASALDKLAESAHKYTHKANGIQYTITQSSGFIGVAKGSDNCSATETTRQSTNSVRITSVVSWAEPSATPSVTATGIVTPPTGSALEIDAANGAPGTIGSAGVAAIVKYIPSETESTASLQGTTGSAGCIVFGGIPATSAIVEIPEDPGYVIPNGMLKWQNSEVEIAPNVTTHDLIPFAPGGAIKAKFTYKGNPVEGDTFVVSNSLMNTPPNYEVGSSKFTYKATGEETATAEPGTYATSSLTPAAPTKYATGNLFPFPGSEWAVYAGDCPENNPATVTKGEVSTGLVAVSPGLTSTVNVPLSLVSLTVYEGTGPLSPGSPSSKELPVSITNTKCAKTTPNNETEVIVKHTQKTSTSGHLQHPYQPFGEFELCVKSEPKAGANRVDKVTYTNQTVAGSTRTIYLGQLSELERSEVNAAAEKAETAIETARVNEEKPTWETISAEEATLATRKTQEATKVKTREAEEKALKTARESEEATKAADVVKEAAEIAKWKEEEKSKKLKPTRAEKEATQTAARKAREAKEAENVAARSKEEATLAKHKTEEEAANATRVKEEAAVAKTRGEQEAIRTSKKTKEAEAKATRVAKEKAEKEEASKEVTVESGGGASC